MLTLLTHPANPTTSPRMTDQEDIEPTETVKYDSKTDVKPTDSNTVDEIKAYLDKNGIKYDSNAKKADLLKLVGD